MMPAVGGIGDSDEAEVTSAVRRCNCAALAADDARGRPRRVCRRRRKMPKPATVTKKTPARAAATMANGKNESMMTPSGVV